MKALFLIAEDFDDIQFFVLISGFVKGGKRDNRLHLGG